MPRYFIVSIKEHNVKDFQMIIIEADNEKQVRDYCYDEHFVILFFQEATKEEYDARYDDERISLIDGKREIMR